MRLLIITPELPPYSSATPIGDACWALPKALRGRGHDVTVLSPLYGFVDHSAHALARRLRKVEVELTDGPTSFHVYDTRTAAGVDLMMLAHDELLGGIEQVPLGDDEPGSAVVFGAFAKAAVQVIRAAKPAFDQVICVDWQTALVPALLREAGVDVPTIMVVSDVRRQGQFEREALARLGLPDSFFTDDRLEFYGKACFLKGGIQAASRVTTVSPSYATEVLQYAAGLEGVFESRGKDFMGIAGGVDTAIWNPTTDAHLVSRYDPMDLSGKRRCKAAMQQALGFPVRDDVPLIAAIGAISPSSGLDVLGRIIAKIMRNDLQLVVVNEGDADPALVDVLTAQSKRWPDRLHVLGDADTTDVHRAFSAADAVIVPPSQAPGGATQLRAHRYGALPIGLRAGAFADTVVDCDARLVTGTGFTYDEASDDVVLATVQRAIGAFAKRRAFEGVRSRAMRADQGWERAAYLYQRLFDSLAPRGAVSPPAETASA